jgi:hypothetical protein
MAILECFLGNGPLVWDNLGNRRVNECGTNRRMTEARRVSHYGEAISGAGGDVGTEFGIVMKGVVPGARTPSGLWRGDGRGSQTPGELGDCGWAGAGPEGCATGR